VLSGNELYQGDERGFQRLKLSPMGADLDIERMVPYNNGLLLVSGSTLLTFRHGQIGPFKGPPGISIAPLHTKSEGLWVKSQNELYELRDGTWHGAMTGTVRALVEHEDGSIVASVYFPRESIGLWEWQRGGKPHHLPLGRDIVDGMWIGPQGDVLALYESGELLMRRNGEWASLEPVPSPMKSMTSASFSAGGNLWIATAEGLFLHKRSASRWTHWRRPGQHAGNRIDEILRTTDGAIWLGTDGGLEIRHADGSIDWYDNILGTKLEIITGLAEDTKGDVWISSGGYLDGAFRWDGRDWHAVGPEEGLHALPSSTSQRSSQGKWTSTSKIFRWRT